MASDLMVWGHYGILICMAETLSLLEKRLLTLAAQGASPEEMANDTGLDAQAAYQKVSDILRRRNVWDEIQQRQLLLHSAFDMKAQLERWIEQGNRFDKDQVTAYLRNLKLLAEILDQHAKATAGQVDKVVDAHKVYMIGLVEKLSLEVVNELHARHPDIEMDEIDGVFQEVLTGERLKVA